MGLFQMGEFTLSSGTKSCWKVDCDPPECDRLTDVMSSGLTADDIETLAWLAAGMVPPFSLVVPVPKGKSASPIDNAMRFAQALRKHVDKGSNCVLICDDVFTSGESMQWALEEFREGESYWNNGADPAPVMGVVMFARNPVPSWIVPVWQLSPMLVKA